MTRFLNMARRSGKTTALIYTASIIGAPILVYDNGRAEIVRQQAHKLGVKAEVITLSDFLHLRGASYSKVLIDEGREIIDRALTNYLQTDVIALTLSLPMTGVNLENEEDKK